MRLALAYFDDDTQQELVLVSNTSDDDKNFAIIYRIKDLNEGIIFSFYAPWRRIKIL